MAFDIGIYKITCVVTNKVYIGQSIELKKRLRKHKIMLKGQYHGNDLLQNDYNMYPNSFKYKIIEYTTVEQLNEREIYWITFYDSYHNGYNLTSGGKGIYTEVDESVRRKISDHRSGIKHSEEAKKKISDSLKKPWSEARRKAYEDKHGHKEPAKRKYKRGSEEHKEYMRKKMKAVMNQPEIKNKIRKTLKSKYSKDNRPEDKLEVNYVIS